VPAFISYSSKDEAMYSMLCMALDAAGIPRWDTTSMALGESLADQLRSAIGHCEACVFIATRRSIESPWCLAELGAFWGAGKRVILFMADPDLAEATLPPQFKGSLRADNGRSLLESLERAITDAQLVQADLERQEFFRSCGDFGSEKAWIELLDHSQFHFDALGVTLSAWRRTSRFKARVLARANAGCHLRFLFMHEESDLLRSVLYKGRSLESVIPLIQESRDFFNDLVAAHENIEARQTRMGAPHFSLTRADDSVVVTQYLLTETWGAGPTWRCSAHSPLFDVARSDFESLWSDAEMVT
jgi:hypothetical protein